MRFTRWITKERIQTHTDILVHIAFPWQQWLCERATMLIYTYIACLIKFYCAWCINSYRRAVRGLTGTVATKMQGKHVEL